MEKEHIIAIEYLSTGGTSFVAKRILPSEINSLEENEIIIVNRARVNSRIIKIEHNFNRSDSLIESYKILNVALNEMLLQEKKHRKTLFGAPMKVKDVKKVFPDILSMPINSFSTNT